jgi:1-acyl-sn-glycerol-3-phosphate acyltransferase
VRFILQPLFRLAARLLLRMTVVGRENVPRDGGLLVTINHLGGADPVLCQVYAPRLLTMVGKIEVLNWPVLSLVARAYAMIPVRRGEVDRAALKRMLDVLEAGGALLIAPEGRESLSGALEAGKTGAAFLALHAGTAILPVGLTGTAWRDVLPAWRRLRRAPVTVTYGVPYRLPAGISRREAADEIMRRIAALLPAEYRGVYANEVRAGEPQG